MTQTQSGCTKSIAKDLKAEGVGECPEDGALPGERLVSGEVCNQFFEPPTCRKRLLYLLREGLQPLVRAVPLIHRETSSCSSTYYLRAIRKNASAREFQLFLK